MNASTLLQASGRGSLRTDKTYMDDVRVNAATSVATNYPLPSNTDVAICKRLDVIPTCLSLGRNEAPEADLHLVLCKRHATDLMVLMLHFARAASKVSWLRRRGIPSLIRHRTPSDVNASQEKIILLIRIISLPPRTTANASLSRAHILVCGLCVSVHGNSSLCVSTRPINCLVIRDR